MRFHFSVKRHRKHRLKKQIYYVALRLVQPEGVLLELQGPDTGDRVRQLFVDLGQRSLTIACCRNFGIYFLL
jgi:hypothetical protein